MCGIHVSILAHVQPGGKLACMFHESGCESHVFAKRINLPGRLLGIGALGQFVPVHFQEKYAVTV
jgi:hypothetical protein